MKAKAITAAVVSIVCVFAVNSYACHLVGPTLGTPNNDAACQNTNLVLHWSGVTGATSYKVYWTTDASYPTWDNVVTKASGARSHLITSLSLNTTYRWKVRALDGGEYADSVVQVFTTTDGDVTAPSTPTWSISPQAVNTTSIEMAASASDPSGVLYEFDETWGGGADSGWIDGPGYTDVGLTPATEYRYKVRARDKSCDLNESGWTDEVIVWTKTIVPDVVGQTQANAEAAIVGAVLAVGNVTTQYSDVIPAGSVISSNPAAQAEVASQSSVDLVVSLGQPVVPDVVGMTEAGATSAITAVDSLVVGTVTNQYSDTVAAGDVISQDPAADTIVAIGTSVDLVVSLGQPVVPNVVGMAEAAASASITAVDSLTVGAVTNDYSDTVSAGDVISQNPGAGSAVPIGSSVDLVVSLGQPVVPDLVGLTQVQAASALADLTLSVGTVTNDYSDTHPAGDVLSQTVAPGTTVATGTSVDLVVSLGQPVVPDISGQTVAAAETTLSAVGLGVGSVSYAHRACL